MNPSYKDYMLKSTDHPRETVEWCIHYSFNSQDTTNPRVFLIGDSICNGYAGPSVEKIEKFCNLTYWASSKCVTDTFYLRELDFYLDYFPYDVICFNNGLHSIYSNREEWTEAYRMAVDFIMAKVPNAKLYLTLCTPLKDPKLTAVSAEMNEIIKATAAERGLDIIDMFTPMDVLDREKYWTDCYHFNAEAKAIQSDIIADAVKKALNNKSANISHAESETGPDGAIK